MIKISLIHQSINHWLTTQSWIVNDVQCERLEIGIHLLLVYKQGIPAPLIKKKILRESRYCAMCNAEQIHTAENILSWWAASFWSIDGLWLIDWMFSRLTRWLSDGLVGLSTNQLVCLDMYHASFYKSQLDAARSINPLINRWIDEPINQSNFPDFDKSIVKCCDHPRW